MMSNRVGKWILKRVQDDIGSLFRRRGVDSLKKNSFCHPELVSGSTVSSIHHRCHPGGGRDPGLLCRAIHNSFPTSPLLRSSSFEAQARLRRAGWIPAYAGMTVFLVIRHLGMSPRQAFRSWRVFFALQKMYRAIRTICLLLILTTTLSAADKIDNEQIKKSVTREIWANLFGGDKASATGKKKKHTARNGNYKYRGRGYERTGGDIYLLPHWPHYSLFFEDNDLIRVGLGFDTASNAYGGRGPSHDLSKLIFGEQPILVKDILLVSKLAKEGKLAVAGGIANHPLSILADQEVIFNADRDQYLASVDYARHFRKGDLTIGFHIPIKMRQQRLKLTNDITSANRTAVQAAASVAIYDFYKKFSNLEEFVTEVLSRKGVALNKKETVLGMSDVVTYASLDIPSNYFDRFVVGASLLLPTARERDTGKLWSSDLGNGGFTELAAFASFLWQRSRWLNFYFHVKGTYGFAANVLRRVPRVNTYTGGAAPKFNGLDVLAGGIPVNSRMLFGETFNFIAAPGDNFTTPDSTVRNFADGTQKVKINPGAECLIRVGNTFDAIFSDKGFVDVYYDLFFKGKDYISRRRVDDVYQPSILTHNTASVRHTAGLTYAYQFDEQYRTRLGINYAFAGVNTPSALAAEVSLNFEF